MAKPRIMKSGAGAAIAGTGADDRDVDALAFRTAVRDVKPLRHAPQAIAQPKPRPRKLRHCAETAAADLDAAMPLIERPPPADADASAGGIVGGDALAFRRVGVRAQVLRRLRRGLIPIDGELDLHGLTQIAARGRLADFLAANRAGGSRCVRIIHGKGYRSGARGPVLKTAVDSWLRRHWDVMAFVSAKAIDGGTGAVYVLLRA